MVNGASSTAPHRENRSVSDGRATRQAPTLPTSSNGRAPADGHRGQHHSEKLSRRSEQPPRAGAGSSSLAGGQGQSGARESFLNYFFGGQDAEVDASAVLRSEVVSRNRGSHGASDILPDLSKGEGRLSGRRGVEGSGAAFDMKSLGKHLEPVRNSFPSLVPTPYADGSLCSGLGGPVTTSAFRP